MQLVVSLPTRGRPQQLLDTVRRSVSNWVLPNTKMVIVADDDDPPTLALFQSGELEKISTNIVPTVLKRPDTVAAKWNAALAVPADLYLIDADDAPFITPGYDAKLLEAARHFPDGIGMVYGHMANLSFSGVLAPTAKFCEKLGYIFPEHFPYWFVDHWIDDICRLIGRCTFADVRTDQTRVGKTQEMREPGWWATWFDAAYLMRHDISRQIIGDSEFATPQWMRQAMLSLPPSVAGARIDTWSKYGPNGGVRDQEQRGQLPITHTVTDRYLRIKQRAVDMVPHLLNDYGMHPQEAAGYRSALKLPMPIASLKRAFA